MTRKRGVVKEGWYDAGRTLTILGKSVTVKNMEWLPIVFDNEEDPTFHKTTSIRPLTKKEESLLIVIKAHKDK